MASPAPTDLTVAPTRLGGSRGAARAPILGVALVLVAVVTAGVLGDRPAVPEPKTDAASGGRIVDAAVIARAIQSAYIGAAAREQPQIKVGPPPWAYNGRVAVPRSTRLRLLGWQVDPYQT